MTNKKHVSVLLDETLKFILGPNVEVVVDATIGGGGHAEVILKSSDAVKLLIGLDHDSEAVVRARKRLAPFGERIKVEKANFADIDTALDRLNINGVDAILMDLGVSSFHLDTGSRGFSFRSDGPLDMRMDRDQELTAHEIVNNYSERDLLRILREYGEEKRAKQIVRAIVKERAVKPINGTVHLADVVESAAPRNIRERRSIHPATRTFQALRIEVNSELDRLGEAITKGVERLNAGGRIAIISFHSLEDRIVKRAFLDMTKRCVCPRDFPICVCGTPGKLKVLTKKPICPLDDEVTGNPRARSAKLRVAERLAA